MSQMAAGDNYMLIDVYKEYCKNVPGVGDRFPQITLFALRILGSVSKDQAQAVLNKHGAADEWTRWT